MKLISNQLSPNLCASDMLSSLWRDVGESEKVIESWFGPNCLLTNSARTALDLIVEVAKPDRRKKIGLPAFICGVVAGSFLARGYEIYWLEVDDRGLLDLKNFEKHAKDIGLLVVPHIFGRRVDIPKIMEIAREHQVLVVEDGAHFVSQLNEQNYCSLTDFQVLSFGREKVVSTVSGGALLWGKSSPYASELAKISLPAPALSWQIRHWVQPIIFSLALPWWNAGGKLIPWLANKLKILPLAVNRAEKEGEFTMPRAKLAYWQVCLLAHQLEGYPKRCEHAQKLGIAWKSVLEGLGKVEVNDFRVILTEVSGGLKSKLATLKSLNTREWEGVPISPAGCDFEKLGYERGSCVRAEKFAKSYLTFPVNIRVELEDIAKVQQALVFSDQARH